jgi:hypothetical protein
LEFKFESGEEREIAKKVGQMVTGFVPGNLNFFRAKSNTQVKNNSGLLYLNRTA